jgi:hypothetical protein
VPRGLGYATDMTENPTTPATDPDGIPEPDEAPVPPLEPSVTNPDADGIDAVPS